MRTLKGGLTNQSPSENHSNQSSDSEPTLPHYLKLEYSVKKNVTQPTSKEMNITRYFDVVYTALPMKIYFHLKPLELKSDTLDNIFKWLIATSSFPKSRRFRKAKTLWQSLAFLNFDNLERLTPSTIDF